MLIDHQMELFECLDHGPDDAFQAGFTAGVYYPDVTEEGPEQNGVKVPFERGTVDYANFCDGFRKKRQDLKFYDSMGWARPC